MLAFGARAWGPRPGQDDAPAAAAEGRKRRRDGDGGDDGEGAAAAAQRPQGPLTQRRRGEVSV